MAKETALKQDSGVRNRPLSPHLQIYKWQFTMLSSILHRASGIILAGGLVAIISGFIFIAMGQENFQLLQYFGGTVIGKIGLFILTLAYSYHFCNGLRHLAWDAGWGFELSTAEQTAKLVALGSIIMTIAIFAIGYGILL